MSAQRISMHRIQEMIRLHRAGGLTTHRIAKSLNMSPNTEREYRQALQKAGLLEGPADDLPSFEELRQALERELPPPATPTQQQSSLLKWRDEIKELHDNGLGATAIHDRLRLKHPGKYVGKIGAMKRMVRQFRKAAGIAAKDVVIPVETRPGQIAQVDFGYAGYMLDPDSGKQRKAWVFVMVLGYSRHMYVEYVFDQRAETWVRLHMNAFKALKGVPEEIVPDNLKAAVLKAAYSSSEDTVLNRSYRELARYYGFRIGPTPPRSPEKKGKVERQIEYVNGNFGAGRDGQDIRMVNEEARRWVREIAGTRRHGSTGRVPLEVFEQEEQAQLTPLPSQPYQVVVWHKATLHRDFHFQFDGRLYSVPWKHVAPKGEKPTEVWARATRATVEAYIQDKRVADHDRNGPGRRSTKEEHLPEHRGDHRQRDPAYWRERAAEYGADVRTLIDGVLDHDPVKSRVDMACYCLRLLAGLDEERRISVTKHALRFGNVHYSELKRIVERELDMQHEPDLSVSSCWGEQVPTFARSGFDYQQRVDSSWSTAARKLEEVAHANA